jgi:hypothetical protein
MGEHKRSPGGERINGLDEVHRYAGKRYIIQNLDPWWLIAADGEGRLKIE